MIAVLVAANILLMAYLLLREAQIRTQLAKIDQVGWQCERLAIRLREMQERVGALLPASRWP